MTDSTVESFVYDGTEWILTGRVASRPVFHKRDVNKQIGKMTVVEIKPAGVTVSDPMLNKWVNPRDLFHIQEVEDIDLEMVKSENEWADEHGCENG